MERRKDKKQHNSAGPQKKGTRPHVSSGVRRKRRRRDTARILLVGILIPLVIVLLLAGTWQFLRWRGARSLAARGTVMDMPELADDSDAAGDGEPSAAGEAAGSGPDVVHTEDLPTGALRYQGKGYLYKEEIRTFLFMGIDRYGEADASDDLYRGGQADALFLAVLDPTEKKVSLIGVPRDTMTEISVFDRGGLYAGKDTAQIALAHAYGEGLEESCENTVDAVSNLFYGLPIHGYAALNMEAIPAVNDAVGGVEVTVPESAVGARARYEGKMYTADWKAGDVIRLEGLQSYLFLKYRDVKVDESAGARLARQKQYLEAFVGRAKQAMKEDLSLPLKLYREITPYMVTNLSADQAVYLAGEALSCSFSQEDIYSLEGHVEFGELFEEFYADETALYELILKVFYEEL